MGYFKKMNLSIKAYSCLEVKFGTQLKTSNKDNKNEIIARHCDNLSILDKTEKVMPKFSKNNYVEKI